MIGYLRLELMRGLRDPRYLVLALVAPVGFYLLFTNLFGAAQGAGANGLPAPVGAMVSMAMFGAMWAVLSATSPRIAQERSIGWLRQLRLLPVRAQSVLTARLIAAVVLAGPALVLVFVTAAIDHGVTLDAWRWVVLLALLWLGAAPIALLGIALGYATDADSAFTITYGLNLVLAALGGLWMPISVLPTGLQTIGKLLPSYQAANLGWHIVGGQAVELSNVLALVAWAAVLSLLALFFAGRVARGR
jgi:ABC-2 type transport system permease protein